MAQPPEENKLLAVAKTGSDLVWTVSFSSYDAPIPAKEAEELLSTVARTSTLLLTLNSALKEYFPSATPNQPFIAPLYKEILDVLQELQAKVDEAKKGRVTVSEGKSTMWESLLNGVGELRKRLEEGKRKVEVLIEGARLKGLHQLEEAERTAEQKTELQELMLRLPIIREGLLGVQKEYGIQLPVVIENVKESAENLNIAKKDGDEILDMSEDVEDLKKIDLKGKGGDSASSTSSVTVFDDSIEEAWLLRRNEPKKVVKSSKTLFSLKVSTTYSHEAASYYVKPIRASASDIRDIRANARGKLTESEHQTALKKMVLALCDNAQWEIQKLLEARDNASSHDNVKREWEMVALQKRPRRKISAPVEKKWWKRGQEPLVEWVMVLRGETVDHQKRVMPVKHEDPWKGKEGKPDATSAEAVNKKADLSTHKGKASSTAEEAEHKMDGVLTDLFKPAIALA